MPETETKCSEWRMLKLPADWEAPAGTERSLNKLHWLCKNDGSRFNCQGPNQDEPLYERSDYWSLWSHFCPTLQMIPQAFFFPPSPPWLHIHLKKNPDVLVMTCRQMSHSEKETSGQSTIWTWTGKKKLFTALISLELMHKTNSRCEIIYWLHRGTAIILNSQLLSV